MQDVRGLALGVLQMSLDDIERSSVSDIMSALQWYRQENRQWWDLGRMLSFFISLPYDSKKKLKRPSDMFPLPWDDAGKPKPSKAEILEMVKKLDKYMDDNNLG